MNCPSRADPIWDHPEWNETPSPLASDRTKNDDLNGIANLRVQRTHRVESSSSDHLDRQADVSPTQNPSPVPPLDPMGAASDDDNDRKGNRRRDESPVQHPPDHAFDSSEISRRITQKVRRWCHVLWKFGTFIGPGFLVSVAYIDPGNYSTDIDAGAEARFHLLFIVLLSNIIAIFLQSLCLKLGTVTGLNLAENCSAHLPKWLNIFLYIMAELAIIATDVAEVIGSAIALNLLLHIPLVWACALTIVDVMVLLLLYNPNGSMRRLRAFEYMVVALVLSVVICFCIQLSLLKDTSVGEVFMGYIPSAYIFKGNGIYLSCGILGATVMSHSLYLGSGIVQPRLFEFDKAAGNVDVAAFDESDGDSFYKYRPSIQAIRFCLNYSRVELALELFTFALFVNSSILIVAGSALSGNNEVASADLFGIHDLLSRSIAPAVGTIFALALLLSGMSAGIVATIAGQMVMEGAIHIMMKPWAKRLMTRSISIIPSIIIAGAVGRDGLNTALTASQVILSVLLPFLSAPVIYFTSRTRYMTVSADRAGDLLSSAGTINMKNNWLTTSFAILIWLVIVVMNVALLVMVGMGKA